MDPIPGIRKVATIGHSSLATRYELNPMILPPVPGQKIKLYSGDVITVNGEGDWTARLPNYFVLPINSTIIHIPGSSDYVVRGTFGPPARDIEAVAPARQAPRGGQGTAAANYPLGGYPRRGGAAYDFPDVKAPARRTGGIVAAALALPPQAPRTTRPTGEIAAVRGGQGTAAANYPLGGYPRRGGAAAHNAYERLLRGTGRYLNPGEAIQLNPGDPETDLARYHVPDGYHLEKVTEYNGIRVYQTVELPRVMPAGASSTSTRVKARVHENMPAGLENVVVAERSTKQQVLERLRSLALRRIPATIVTPEAKNEAIESILELIPTESRSIDAQGNITYPTKYINTISEFLPSLNLPIPFEDTFELQQLIRQTHGDELHLLPEEISDSQYPKPLPIDMPDANMCDICYTEVSENVRLYTLHYNHDTTNTVCRACKCCIFNDFKTKMEEVKPYPSYGCECFASKPDQCNCQRPVTEYQMAKLCLSEPNQICVGAEPVRNRFLELIKSFRQVFHVEAQKRETAAAEQRQRDAAEQERLAAIAAARNEERRREAERQRALAQYHEYERLEAGARRSGITTLFNTASATGSLRYLDNDCICPFCLDPINLYQGCMYLFHSARGGGGGAILCPSGILPFVSETFRLPPGQMPSICLCCGRPCTGHGHYPLNGGSELYRPPPGTHIHYYPDKDNLEYQCKIQGGGGRIEFIVRLIALRDGIVDLASHRRFAFGLPERDAIARRTYEYTNSSRDSADPTNPYARAREYMRTGRFDNELPKAPTRPRHLPGNAGYDPERNEPPPRVNIMGAVLGWLGSFTRDRILRPVAQLCSVRHRTRRRRSQKRKTRRQSRKN